MSASVKAMGLGLAVLSMFLLAAVMAALPTTKASETTPTRHYRLTSLLEERSR